MTEMDIVETVALLGSNSFSIFSVYLSITFAYLTVAYFVGDALTRFQVVSISGLYVASAGVAEIACVATTETWVNIIREHPTIVNRSVIYTVDVWHIYMAILMASGIIVSLYFMYDVRKRKANRVEESGYQVGGTDA